jgi:hypothetical protein
MSRLFSEWRRAIRPGAGMQTPTRMPAYAVPTASTCLPRAGPSMRGLAAASSRGGRRSETGHVQHTGRAALPWMTDGRDTRFLIETVHPRPGTSSTRHRASVYGVRPVRKRTAPALTGGYAPRSRPSGSTGDRGAGAWRRPHRAQPSAADLHRNRAPFGAIRARFVST